MQIHFHLEPPSFWLNIDTKYKDSLYSHMDVEIMNPSLFNLLMNIAMVLSLDAVDTAKAEDVKNLRKTVT